MDTMAAFGVFLGYACLLGLTGGFSREEWLTEMKIINLRFDIDLLYDNLTDLVSIHTDDVTVMPPGLPAIDGIEDYRKALEDKETGEDVYYINQLSEEIIAYTNDSAIFRIIDEVKFKPESEMIEEKCLLILRKTGGKALVQLVIWNYSS